MNTNFKMGNNRPNQLNNTPMHLPSTSRNFNNNSLNDDNYSNNILLKGGGGGFRPFTSEKMISS